MGKRKRHTAAFKAKVASERIRGEKTANEPARLYQVTPLPLFLGEAVRLGLRFRLGSLAFRSVPPASLAILPFAREEA